MLLALPGAPNDENSRHFLNHLGANVAQHHEIVKLLLMRVWNKYYFGEARVTWASYSVSFLLVLV